MTGGPGPASGGRPGRLDRTVRLAGGLGATWMVAYTAAALTWPGATWISMGAYFIPIVAACLLSARAAWRCPAADRLFWRLTLGYVTLWLAGELFYAYLALRGAGDPNASDVLFLAAYVPMTLTVIAAAGAGGWHRRTMTAVMDAFMVTAGVGCFGFTMLLESRFAGDSTLALVVLSAYPLLDLLVVLLVVLVSLGRGVSLPLAHKLVMVSFVAATLSDVAFTSAALQGGYVQGAATDLGWQAQGVFVCLAAVVGARPRSCELRPRLHSFDAGVWLLIGTAGLVVAGLARAAIEAGVAKAAIAGAVAGVVMLTARMLSGEREIRRAHRREHERANQLEEMVAARTATLAHTITALDRSQRETVRRLGKAIHLRSEETGAHVDRLAESCGLVARSLGLDERTCELLEVASPLHDIGKIAVPDAVLGKPGRLTGEERALIQRHAEDGYRMLEGSDQQLLQVAAEIARCHHERWDGRGYPRGLAGEAIPLVARIVSVCDVFDALTSDRVYRPALPLRHVIGMLREGAGTQFDPEVVDAFLAVLPQVLAVAGTDAERGRAA